MSRARRSWILIACLAVCAVASAGCRQRQAWSSYGIGGGGGLFVPSSSPHDPNLMFCASDMSGVYRSADAGRTWRMLPWRQLSRALACAVAFDPTDPNVCYTVQGPWSRQVLKVSRDRGRTWTPLTDRTPWAAEGQAFRIDTCPAGRALFVAAGEKTFRSADAGATWAPAAGLDGTLHRIVFAPPGPDGRRTAYAGTAKGAFASTDRGRTWTPCGPVPGAKLHDWCAGGDEKSGRFVMYCSVPGRDEGGRFAGGIYRSEDRGATWVQAMGPGINTDIGRHGPVTRTVPDYPFCSMATNRPDTVYAYGLGTGTRAPWRTTVYRTDDGGRSWRAVLVGPQYAKGRNVDLGWMDVEQGWSDGIISFHVNPRNADVVAYSSATEIYLTTDGGRRWRQAYSRCIDGEPARGQRWVGVGLEMTTCWRYRFDPHDPSRTYICYTDIGFARSMDRGRSWMISTAGCPWDNTFYNLEFDPDRPGVLYAACADRHDIPSWKMAGGSGGRGGVCISTNWGKTWRPISVKMPTVGSCMAVVLDPASPPEKRTFWAIWHGGGVYKSTDGGKTWAARNAGLNLARNSHFTDLKRCRDGTLYALCGGKKTGARTPAAIGGLFRSSDGGETWTELTAGLKLFLPYGFDVHADDSRTLWLCASAVPGHHDQGGVYKSTDAGKTWTKLKIDWPAGGAASYVSCMFPSIDPYRPRRVWVNSGTHGLVVTPDGGKTWREVKGMPFRPVTRITVDPTDRETIWAASFGGGIWRGPAMGEK